MLCVSYVQAFVQNYDIYIMLDMETDPTPTRLTFDGSAIIDRIPDWVYEDQWKDNTHA